MNSIEIDDATFNALTKIVFSENDPISVAEAAEIDPDTYKQFLRDVGFYGNPDAWDLLKASIEIKKRKIKETKRVVIFYDNDDSSLGNMRDQLIQHGLFVYLEPYSAKKQSNIDVVLRENPNYILLYLSRQCYVDNYKRFISAVNSINNKIKIALVSNKIGEQESTNVSNDRFDRVALRTFISNIDKEMLVD